MRPASASATTADRRSTRPETPAPPPEIALARLARAKPLGITDKEYTLEIMERGKYL